MNILLDGNQINALKRLSNGKILNGDVGSGKSRVSIAYYYYFILQENKVRINNKNVKLTHNNYDRSNIYIFNIDKKLKKYNKLIIITTARKRDNKEWEKELSDFCLLSNEIIIDSWNNIKKYKDVKNAFFIFDEQRLVGYGSWVKTFLKISKTNLWILLSATPGDTWLDYVPVFIANGFYKNKTEFLDKHVVYSRFSKYPKIDRILSITRLAMYKKQIIIDMPIQKKTVRIQKEFIFNFNKDLYFKTFKRRFNFIKNEPIKNISELCYLLRRISNTADSEKNNTLYQLIKKHKKVIIFYNFNYELEILKDFLNSINYPFTEWNGSKHEAILNSNKWVYLTQYTSNAEGWNCIETNCIVFYSLNYSYKIMLQAMGRIDRRNTPYKDLYYYIFRSNSSIDKGILRALKLKKKFNEKNFVNS